MHCLVGDLCYYACPPHYDDGGTYEEECYECVGEDDYYGPEFDEDDEVYEEESLQDQNRSVPGLFAQQGNGCVCLCV